MASDKTSETVVAGVTINWKNGECVDGLRIAKDFGDLVAKQTKAGYTL